MEHRAILKDATPGNTSYNIQSILNGSQGQQRRRRATRSSSLDNEEAMEVVDNIPFTREHHQRQRLHHPVHGLQDVGVKLKITPRIRRRRLAPGLEGGAGNQPGHAGPHPHQRRRPASSPRPPSKRVFRSFTILLRRTARRRSSAACSTIRRPATRAKSPGSAASPCARWLFKSRNSSRPRPTCSSSSRPRSSERGRLCHLTREKQLVPHETGGP